METFGWQQNREMLSYHLVFTVAKKNFRPAIPGKDPIIQVRRDNQVRGIFD